MNCTRALLCTVGTVHCVLLASLIVPDFLKCMAVQFSLFRPHSRFFAFSLYVLSSLNQRAKTRSRMRKKRRENEKRCTYMNCRTQKVNNPGLLDSKIFLKVFGYICQTWVQQQQQQYCVGHFIFSTVLSVLQLLGLWQKNPQLQNEWKNPYFLFDNV